VLTTHQRKQVRERSSQGQSVFVIAMQMHVPRAEVRKAVDGNKNGRGFTCEELPGVPQLTDDEAELAANPSRMSPQEEEFLSRRVQSVAASIRAHNANKLRGAIHV
jgi:hypothetical protein